MPVPTSPELLVVILMIGIGWIGFKLLKYIFPIILALFAIVLEFLLNGISHVTAFIRNVLEEK